VAPEAGLYLGLMSGTSADAIDAALVHVSPDAVQLRGFLSDPLPGHIRQDIAALCQAGDDEIERLGTLDLSLGDHFATAALRLLDGCGVASSEVVAIGSHGQTIRHRPHRHFTLQIGSPHFIAERTGITTIAEFRQRDMVLEGQGAPLVPRFHQKVFSHPDEHRIILNLGGIANVTLLQGNELVGGFDTGPANTLLDQWYQKHHPGAFFDNDGNWARQGTSLPALLARFMNEPYLSLPPPKSTGREIFNRTWLEGLLDGTETPVDVQATLTEFTAATLGDAIRPLKADRILVCGGGACNSYLQERLRSSLAQVPISGTESMGLAPETVEAAAFAWLAWAYLNRVPGNAPQVTGAKRAAILGACFPA